MNMANRILVIASVLLAIFATLRQVGALSSNGANVCRRTVSYTQAYNVPYRQQYVRVFFEFCWDWNLGFRCRVHRTAYRTGYRRKTRTVYRTQYYCCPGWRQLGNQCPIAICRSGCVNGGRCVRPNVCQCPSGYTGKTCARDIDECARNNGGCSQTCRNTVGSFLCACTKGFVLDGNKRSCSDHDECATSSHGCEQRCVNSRGSYECACEDGYLLKRDAKTCREIDECASGPCQQVCTDRVNGYTCSCLRGYEVGASDNTTCDAICPQGCGNGGKCATPGICECAEGWGGHSCDQPLCGSGCEHGECVQPDLCICTSGWEGAACGDDVNECAEENGGCDHECVNSAGSYKCECHVGYMLSENEHSCTDHDECKLDNHGCQYCENIAGSYRCTCPDGFVIGPDGKTCEDIDECDSSPCQQTCMNEPGSFQCICQSGFVLDANGIDCNDIDECGLNKHACEHRCVNTYSWYTCACDPGYRLAVDGLACFDVNECLDENVNDCPHECVNLNGTYECKCFAGYAQTDEGCEAVCQPSCANEGICVAPGTCKCANGWTGSSCSQDVNECEEETDQCSQVCNNVDGGFLCSCHVGYRLENGKECVDIDECESESSNKCMSGCANTPGSYVCTCDDGFTLDTNGFSCSDHDECATGSHECDHCANTLGSYSCFCPENYYMEPDGKTCTPICDPPCLNGGACTAPNTCNCTSDWRGRTCGWEANVNHWTLNSTGCQCYFDNTRMDCACCVMGGCQCDSSRSNQCVQCGYGHMCDAEHDLENKNGVDAWTLIETGCACPSSKDQYDCACCQNRGCQCGGNHKNRCIQCGLTFMCDRLKPWE